MARNPSRLSDGARISDSKDPEQPQIRIIDPCQWLLLADYRPGTLKFPKCDVGRGYLRRGAPMLARTEEEVEII
jgi:hypothetical protein